MISPSILIKGCWTRGQLSETAAMMLVNDAAGRVAIQYKDFVLASDQGAMTKSTDI